MTNDATIKVTDDATVIAHTIGITADCIDITPEGAVTVTAVTPQEARLIHYRSLMAGYPIDPHLCAALGRDHLNHDIVSRSKQK